MIQMLENFFQWITDLVPRLLSLLFGIFVPGLGAFFTFLYVDVLQAALLDKLDLLFSALGDYTIAGQGSLDSAMTSLNAYSGGFFSFVTQFIPIEAVFNAMTVYGTFSFGVACMRASMQFFKLIPAKFN